MRPKEEEDEKVDKEILRKTKKTKVFKYYENIIPFAELQCLINYETRLLYLKKLQH